jgi:multidrug efflux pump subunit AcrA (membrane-fusion protein)
VPSRRRPKTPTPDAHDPISRFGAALRDAAEQERAAAERARLEREAAEHAARVAAEHAAALEAARRELDRSIRAVRDARTARVGGAEADAAWRVAKARVIELETGAPPSWAPGNPTGVDHDGVEDDRVEDSDRSNAT